MSTVSNSLDDFSARGVAIYQRILSPADLSVLEGAFPKLAQRTPGARAEAFSPEARAWLACHEGLLELARLLSGASARLSRIQAFDKSAGSNWFVPWHQDRAENGRDRAISTLEATVALRIHLDDCHEGDGPLEVLPGSHTSARLDAAAIARMVATTPSYVCLADRGDIIAMRPLLVHCSRRARNPTARRVIHLEFMASRPD